MDYSPWFDFLGVQKSSEERIPPEKASQREQNGTNFNFVAPSSEESGVIYMYECLKCCCFFTSTAVTTFTIHVSVVT